MLTHIDRWVVKNDHSFILFQMFVFFSLFSIVGPRPLTLLKAPTRSMLKLESTSAYSHTAKSSIWHFNVVKYLEKRNNSSTTSLVQHHAQPVEEHACSMRMEELWAVCVVLLSALRWFLICLFECIQMSHYVDRVIHCKLTHLWFHQFCSAPWGQSSMPKVLCYPQCFTLIIVLEL